MLRTETLRLVIVSALLCITVRYSLIHAQVSFDDYKRQTEERFNQFKAIKQNEFEEYSRRVNQDFAEFMRQKWQEFEVKPAIPAPPSPEPPAPVVAPQDEEPADELLPYNKVTRVPDMPQQPIPLLPTQFTEKPSTLPEPSISQQPAPKPKAASTPTVSFDFYGTSCSVPFDNALRFSFSDISENSVANAWNRLASDKSLDLIERCVYLRDKLHLPDWGYFRLTEKVADAVFPNNKNEATLLQMFILTQSGYKVRIGRNGSHLVVMIPCSETICNYTYVTLGNMDYYIIDRSKSLGSISIYNREFPREQTFSLAMAGQPTLSVTPSTSRRFNSQYGAGINTEIAVNKNLIDFYNDYPLINGNWDIHANALLSDGLRKQLYPVLLDAIEGQNETQAANILLRFVQTAFEYKTDGEQFGVERSFFPDETFFYPFSDCEDRAILYSVLVRELLGLDVVLVHYEGHLATAVRFNNAVTGDYFDIDGHRYTVCDPTYINSNVGMAMPQYKGSPAEILKL